MLLNSLQFLVFFPVTTLLYFLLPHRFRWILLLLSSCVFYLAFIPVYIFILFFTIIVDYIAGMVIEPAIGRRRKLALVASIFANCGVLAFFKYYNFLGENLAGVFQLLHIHASLPALSIILPVGLSFHTFQAMSYTIEVYRGRQKAIHHAGIYALYVMFYPQLVAGPIERPQNLIHQFLEKHSFDYARVVSGLRLMLWGLFKKMVIGDGLAQYVDQVYGNPSSRGGIHLLAASLFFMFEIYCDFSGYSDIAIGAASVLGIKLMTNFNSPYASRSIAEFWKRWHISLSTWLRDYLYNYLYIPLRGNQARRVRSHVKLLVTFLVCGLWHGPMWHYVAWGGLNGFYLLASAWTRPLRQRAVGLLGLQRYPALHHFIQVASTFAMLCVAGIFFRAGSIRQALWIIKRIVTYPGPLHGFVIGSRMDFAALMTFVILMEVVQMWQRRGDIFSQMAMKPVWVRWFVYYAAVFAILLFGHFDQRQFIYFQF